MEILNYLAKIISNEINITLPAARGLLKLSIKDEFGPFKPIREIKFSEMVLIINKSLKERFIALNIQNYDKILNILLMELNKNQSLFTLEKV